MPVRNRSSRCRCWISARGWPARRASPQSSCSDRSTGGNCTSPARDNPSVAAQNAVSSGFFDVLGAPPMIGRTFRAADDLRGARPTVVLSADGLAAAVLVRSRRRRTTADRRRGQEGRRLRSDRRHAGRSSAFLRARRCGRRWARRSSGAAEQGWQVDGVRAMYAHWPPGARCDRRERRRRALDHRSQRGAEERNGEHVDERSWRRR